MNCNHVRVSQGASSAGLLLEPLEIRRIDNEMWQEHLDGIGSIHEPVPDLVHHAHAAFANALENLVAIKQHRIQKRISFWSGGVNANYRIIVRQSDSPLRISADSQGAPVAARPHGRSRLGLTIPQAYSDEFRRCVRWIRLSHPRSGHVGASSYYFHV